LLQSPRLPSIRDTEPTIFADQALAAGALLQLQTLSRMARERLTERFHSLAAEKIPATGLITLKLPRIPLFREISDPQISYRPGMTRLQLLEALPASIRNRFILDVELDPDSLLTRREIGVAEDRQEPTWGAALQDEKVKPGKNYTLILRGDDFLAAIDDGPKERSPKILQAAVFFMITGAVAMLLGYYRYGVALLLIGIKIVIELKTPPWPGSGGGSGSVDEPRSRRNGFLFKRSA